MDSLVLNFSEKGNLKKEKRKIMSRDFFCERCSLQFGKKYVFDLHLSLVHGEKIEVKVELPLCEENLQDSQISEKEFSCQSLDKREKPFNCNMCNASFT